MVGIFGKNREICFFLKETERYVRHQNQRYEGAARNVLRWQQKRATGQKQIFDDVAERDSKK